MEAAVNSKHRDRLSELPDSLTHLILAFLPMREVVSTSLLSKRWKDLWKTVPCLNFCDNLSELENGAESFRNFVNRVLMFWKGGKLSKFKIDIGSHFDGSLACDIDLWVRFAIENEVDELNLHLMYELEIFEEWVNDLQKWCKEELFYAPQCLNACTSMTKLSLVGCNLRIREPTSWNQLKSLRIDGFCYRERVINRILLGSPRLEVFELRLMEDYVNLNIRSASLKRLKIEKYLYYGECGGESSDNNVLRIWCPNLEVLEFSGVLYPKYVFTNVSSLTNVTLGFEYSETPSSATDELFEESLEQIFSTVQHVDRVKLSTWCVQVLGALQKKYLLLCLPNVKFFPNLKMLNVIEDTSDPRRQDRTKKYLGLETQLSKSFLLQLKTVNITSSLNGSKTFRFIKFLLKEASMLETLVIWDRGASHRQARGWSKLAEALLCMQRSSPTARVILKKC